VQFLIVRVIVCTEHQNAAFSLLKSQKYCGFSPKFCHFCPQQRTACEQSLHRLCGGNLDGQRPDLAEVLQACQHAVKELVLWSFPIAQLSRAINLTIWATVIKVASQTETFLETLL
jgi:hypothetical protein